MGLFRNREALGVVLLPRAPGLEDEIWNMDELSLLEKSMTCEIIGILSMSDDEFARNEKNRREFRVFLRSLLKEDQEQPKARPTRPIQNVA